MLILIFVCWIQPAFSNINSSVPIEDPSYGYIDQLAALGLITDTIDGQRPWSVHEFARLTRVAKDTLEANPSSLHSETAIKIIEKLHQTFDVTDSESWMEHAFFKRIGFGFTQLNSSNRIIPTENGVGFVDAITNPLVQNQNGLHFVRGQNFTFDSEHEFRLSPYVSFFFRPTFQFFRESSHELSGTANTQELYLKATFSNVSLLVGRDHLAWGHSANGGLLLTNNAQGLDMIKISNESPIYHPWIFRHLGPSKYTFFVAHLGSDRVFSNSLLYGLKLSYKPFRLLEFGFSETVIMGGDGAPPVGIGGTLNELFPIKKAGNNTQFADLSDHRFGFFDLKVLLPFLRNSSFYFESFFDDSPFRALGKHFTSNFLEQTGLMFGLSVPRVSPNGDLSAIIEYKHIPPFAYRHGNWTTGYALERQLLADPLGPDAEGIYLHVKKRFRNLNINKTTLSFERRGGSKFAQTADPNTGGFAKVVVQTPFAPEDRFAIFNHLNWQGYKEFGTTLSLGYEYVKNFAYSDQNRNNFLVGFQVNFHPKQ